MNRPVANEAARPDCRGQRVDLWVELARLADVLGVRLDARDDDARNVRACRVQVERLLVRLERNTEPAPSDD